jgi:hypothetical protein
MSGKIHQIPNSVADQDIRRVGIGDPDFRNG